MPIRISDEEVEGLLNDFSSFVIDVNRIANAMESLVEILNERLPEMIEDGDE